MKIKTFSLVTILFCFLLSLNGTGQESPVADITFDFNNQSLNEKNGKLKIKAVGVSLVADRFGNKASAVHVNGNLYSYLNLGTSPLLKPKKATISIWINIDREIPTGRGIAYNPIIVTKNSENRGWYNAYNMGFELASNHLTGCSNLDSTKNEAIVVSKDSLVFNKWYHLVMAFDNDSIWFYIDGELQSKSVKGFETIYLSSDSVVVGHSASKVNERFSQGIFDDIQIFHKVLSPAQINALYNAPNPNEFKRKLNEAIRYGLIVIGALLVVLFILYRNKQKLRKQKEQLELNNRIAELEMQVVKTQMNPHFISNCLAAIQELIYNNNIEKAGLYIAKFSLFMRQVLNYSDKTYITLTEELELIKLNVELEQLRFRDNFEFNIELAPDLNMNELMIPSLITQPVIENAIWHGLLPLKEKRKPTLNLRIHQRDESLFVEIEDNGVGRDLTSAKGKESRGTRLIKDRLDTLSRLSGSANYRMEIIDLVNEKNEGSGTKVILQVDNNKE